MFLLDCVPLHTMHLIVFLRANCLTDQLKWKRVYIIQMQIERDKLIFKDQNSTRTDMNQNMLLECNFQVYFLFRIK